MPWCPNNQKLQCNVEPGQRRTIKEFGGLVTHTHTHTHKIIALSELIVYEGPVISS